ncbi:ribonuclease Z, mitochondrial-like [Palaemon carinicauda]|uniref:ribonuclease Z, mitochondrial-like n=1 Tax=Palaemon carinicauda TaxID=392227 RepID=UPI0035B59C85
MYLASCVVKRILSVNAVPLATLQILRSTIRNYSHKKKLLDILNSMPKKVDVKELQGIRLARKEKLRKYSPSTVYLQVLGSGAPGSPRSLYVFTEQARFLFNCGEGSQRLAYEHKVKLGMMEHILITHKSWSNVGGLPGILLTLQDTGVPEINLHGPAGIESLYYGTRHFIRFRDLNINYRHYTENNGIIGDANDPLSIEAVPLWAKEESSSGESSEKDSLEENEEEVEDLYAHEQSWIKKNPGLRRDYLTAEERSKMHEESRKCKNLSVAYICRPPPKAGALLLQKCVKEGVPPGPLLGDLKRGQNVTLPNGKVVLASEVTAPDDPGPVFIVVETPTVAYLDSLLESTAFTKYQASAAGDGDLAEVVVHFTPAHVMKDPRYQEWMSRFSKSTSHLCINEGSLCMGSEAVHRIQYKLNLLSEHLFPLLKDQSIPLKKIGDNGKDCSDNQDGINGNTLQTGTSTESNHTTIDNSGTSVLNSDLTIGPIHQATTLMTYHIRPRKKLDRSSELSLTPETYKAECYAMNNFTSALEEAKLKLLESVGNAEESNSYPNIIFLGTGSCIPNKTRNTSGILLNLSDTRAKLRYIIFDIDEKKLFNLIL